MPSLFALPDPSHRSCASTDVSQTIHPQGAQQRMSARSSGHSTSHHAAGQTVPSGQGPRVKREDNGGGSESEAAALESLFDPRPLAEWGTARPLSTAHTHGLDKNQRRRKRRAEREAQQWHPERTAQGPGRQRAAAAAAAALAGQSCLVMLVLPTGDTGTRTPALRSMMRLQKTTTKEM